MQRLAKLTLVVVVLILFTVTAFGLGVVVGRAAFLLAPQGATSLLGLPGGATPAGDPAADPEDLDTFWQVWDLAHERFIDRQALDDTELEYGAIRGLVQALGDEGHTVFLTPDEFNRQRSDISGTFSGIGAYVGVRDGLPVIVAPFEGSPAEAAGVRAGDAIIEVDGEDVTTRTLNDVVELIRGEAGTEVVLTLLRPEAGQSLEVTVTRGEITVPAATWAMVPGTDVALVRLSQFSANATEELTAALRRAQAAGATALIVDVRNNPGGLLDQAIEVTSQFLTDGNVLQQEDAEGQRKAFPVRKGGLAPDIPLVVLINQGSASSSEIFAGAIQDHVRGTLVGETTFGTGTVLEPFVLDDGSGLMLGTRQWLTADGRLIRKVGIAPDVTVELPLGADLLYPREVGEMTAADLLQSEDTQLLKALELLGALPTTSNNERSGLASP